jgi:rfaE bifunctional protein nucleotidyltransferase chain/domain
MSSVRNPKIKNIDELRTIIAQAQASGKRVVFANGCFDLIHVGHIRYLQGARNQGDLLVVAINDDSSVKLLKGPGRPLQSQEERAEIISSFYSVDFVTVFTEPTVDNLLKVLKPDIHAKGTDYRAENVPERETVRSYGGKVAIVGDPKDHATRDLIKKIVLKFD